jgi:osmotically-inducible protein OsmY
MAGANAQAARPDIDIERDLEEIVKSYPPSNSDRHHLYLTVSQGSITLRGHIKTPMTRRVLISRFQNVAGVRSLHADELYDDETIRLMAGKMVPPGALVNSDYGTLVLAGHIESEKGSQITQQLERIPGVKRVVNVLKD